MIFVLLIILFALGVLIYQVRCLRKDLRKETIYFRSELFRIDKLQKHDFDGVLDGIYLLSKKIGEANNGNKTD